MADEKKALGGGIIGTILGTSTKDGIETYPTDAEGHVMLPASLSELTPEQLHEYDTKLLRKVDGRILPIIFFLYFANFLDRTNISQATIANSEAGHTIFQTIGLTLDQYNWANTILFFPYVLFEYPSNIILKWATPSKWIGRIGITWGIVAMTFGAITDYKGLYICRFMLGLMEAGLSPGVTYYLTFWYRRSERGLRLGAFFLGGSLSGALGGLLAAGIFQLDTKGGLYGWQWTFIIEGIPSIIMGVVTLLFLPDFPRTTKWLTPEERQYMEHRLTGEAGSDSRGDAWVWSEFYAFLRNPLSYTFCIIQFCNSVAVYGPSAYASVILNTAFGPVKTGGLGFSSTAIVAMGATTNFWGIIMCLIMVSSADYRRDRYFHLLFGYACVLASFGLFATTYNDRPWTKFGALFLANSGLSSATPLLMAWRTDSAYGTTYSATVTAVTLAFGNIGGAVAPQLFFPSAAPLYFTTFWILFGLVALSVVLVTVNYAIEYFIPETYGPNGPYHFKARHAAAVARRASLGTV
ncbi:hypothetical protein SmJEL517_g04127 [Synchytrium microbalum]|uniref:Major facilitator superfamily (MFS) profile domain-containing protein n=1 Tax=Synchytrium microbalum TaxID=1806994 RepID=A0A507BZD1_9FUNG|nr:uncharacterized protein SmJEL517_g04127 [Synchytrium microbalum]TPX32782.1 hypothetical protein SmJEL517_g04127 [Synchytrium microbalum]